MSLYPFLRSPFTDLSGHMFNYQTKPHALCAKFEMQLFDCLEAYGTDAAGTRCRDLALDLKECAYKDKQYHRVWRMQHERHLQHYLGNREKHYEEPPKFTSL